MMRIHELGTPDRRDASRAYTRTPDYAPAELVERVSERLKPVCAHFPKAAFDVLVRHVAHIEWKYDQRGRTADYIAGEAWWNAPSAN